MDSMYIATLYKGIMEEIGIEVDENSKDTPERVGRMLVEIFENVGKDPYKELEPVSVFPAKNSERVTVKDIPIVSYCSHHHLPFIGKISVTYVPNKNIVGLSKIPRIIKWFCKKPQLQEYLTNEIGEFLVNILDPISLQVSVYDCVHTCMLCRGVQSDGSTDTYFHYERKRNE